MLLELTDISKHYGTRAVVDRVSVEVEEGQFVSLLGPSGSGKSTILRMVAGLIPSELGVIKIDGAVVSEGGREIPPEKRNIGMVFQDYALWPHMTVGQNIAFGLKLRRWPRRRVQQRVQEMLELVRLEGLHGRYPFELSGGQQQRVALARALSTDPRLILLDEPLSNLDRQLRQTLRQELVALLKRVGMTAVYVTHDYSEAMEMSDAVVVLRDGCVEQQGTPTHLYERPESLFVETFLGATNLFSGQVEERNGAVGVATGQTWLAGQPGRGLGSEGVLCVRPEAVQILAAPTNGNVNMLEGTMIRSGFLGDHWQHFCSLADGSAVQITSFHALPVGPGDPVHLFLPPDRCRILASSANVLSSI